MGRTRVCDIWPAIPAQPDGRLSLEECDRGEGAPRRPRRPSRNMALHRKAPAPGMSQPLQVQEEECGSLMSPSETLRLPSLARPHLVRGPHPRKILRLQAPSCQLAHRADSRPGEASYSDQTLLALPTAHSSGSERFLRDSRSPPEQGSCAFPKKLALFETAWESSSLRVLLKTMRILVGSKHEAHSSV